MPEWSYPAPAVRPTTVRVAILDALPASLAALRVVIEAEQGFLVVGEAGNGVEAIGVARARGPHVLLVDAGMPGAGCCDALRQLRTSGLEVPAVVLADGMAGTEVVDALTVGARGLVLRNARLQVLFACLRAVAEGAFWVGHERVRDVVDAFRRVREARSPASPSTSRRRRVTPAP